jgi:hypothetical protein
MAFMTVKLMPGVHAEPSPLLLTAAIVNSNMIRFRDGLFEKLGGWMTFAQTSGGVPFVADVPGIVREICAWSDFDAVKHLAVAGDQGLQVGGATTGGGNVDLTPQYEQTTVPQASFNTTAGSPLVTINQTAVTTNTFGTVEFENYLSVGGVVLFGSYNIVTADPATTGSGEVQIDAAMPATSTVWTGGVVPTYTTTALSKIVTVALPNHGLTAGEQYSAEFPTTVGAITIQGSYTILDVIDVNSFTIGAAQAEGSTGHGPVSDNGGLVGLFWWIAPGPTTQTGLGWGNGGWGMGGWGVGQPTTTVSGTKLVVGSLPLPPGVPQPSSLDWCMVNWGETLVAQPEGFGFFEWDPSGGQPGLTPISAAPEAATGFFLAMPQQMLVAYGASTGESPLQDPMLIRWCDAGDYNDWVASAANQAGSFRLPRGSRIVGGLQAPQQAMLWTDIGFWLMTYIGYPDVWGFAEIAQECGLISKKAACVCGPQVFWMGFDQFWTYAQGMVQPMQCEVWDAVFQNLIQMAPDPSVLDHIRCVSNAGFNEVYWFFPSRYSANKENDSYVKFNRLTGEWDFAVGIPLNPATNAYDPVAGIVGGLACSERIDVNVYGHPISALTQADGSSLIVQHEMGHDAPNDAGVQPMHWWVKTGLFLLSEGEDFIFVDRMLPDFRWRLFQDPQTKSSTVKITLYTQDEPDNPTKPPNVFGPFTMTNASGPDGNSIVVDPRARGRYFSMFIEGDDLGSFTRMGGVKFRFAPDGRN